MLLAHMFARGHQEAGGAAGRVANLIGGLRVHHRDHRGDDVPRRAKLAVDSGAGDLGQQVLVEVTVGVAVRHWDVVDHVDHARQQCGVGDGEPGILHVLGVG